MVLDSKLATASKMQGKLESGPPRRSLRSSNARTVLASKENCIDDPKHIPRTGKNNRKACSRRPYNDIGISSQSPNVKVSRVLGEMKKQKNPINVGKRSTRTALKIYDYCETDPDVENRPAEMPRKKSRIAGKPDKRNDSKHKRSTQVGPTVSSKGKSIVNSSYFLCGEKTNRSVKSQYITTASRNVVTEPKLKKKTASTKMLGSTTKTALKPKENKFAAVVNKDMGRKLSSLENSTGDTHNKLSVNGKCLNMSDLPKQLCSTPIISRVPATLLSDVSPVSAETVVKCSVPQSQRDSARKICQDVSDAFVNVSCASKHEEVDPNTGLTECGELHMEVCYAEVHREPESEEMEEEVHPRPSHLDLTSTPEKNLSSVASSHYSSFVDSGMDDVVRVTLYDSPKKLSPIKTIASAEDSSLSDDSCCWDDEFESTPQRTDDGTPVKNDDEEEKVMKSFKAYHTPHQFRRHLFKKKSKKASQKGKSKSPAEVKLDLWASFMNDHFEDIEDSELVIE